MIFMMAILERGVPPLPPKNIFVLISIGTHPNLVKPQGFAPAPVLVHQTWKLNMSAQVENCDACKK